MESNAEIRDIASKACLYVLGEVRKLGLDQDNELTAFRNVVSEIGKADEYAERMVSITETNKKSSSKSKSKSKSESKSKININFERDFTDEEKLQVAKIASDTADELYYKVNELEMNDYKKTVVHYHVLKISLEAIERTFEIVGIEKGN